MDHINIKGMFLCIGPDIQPSVRILSKDQHVRMIERKNLCSKPENIVLSHKIAFGTFGITHAIPAWSENAMLAMTSYTGPHQSQVRSLAAVLALGQIIPTDNKDKDNGGGARKPVTVPPDAPVSPDAVPLFAGI